MKRITSIAAVACAAIAAPFSMQAKVTLPHIFGDNMVLQQQTDVNFWGTAEASAVVSISPSWLKAEITTRADAQGKWEAAVNTPEAGGPYTVTISDGEDLALENVLIGEVWICSGQSNMEMPMKGFADQPVEGAADIIIGAKASVPIRMCTVRRAAEFTPQDDCDATWLENVPEAVANTSATAYCFARYIHDVLDVPVGIIVTCWGGSSIEAWMDRQTIASEFPEFDLGFIDRQEMPKNENHAPSLLYNGMLHPVIPFTVKGMIWYQGEQNRFKPEQYLKLQPAFVQMMRDQWGLGEFPFYYVQIAPYRYESPEDDNSARLRESQLQALELIPNSGMAVTLDAGDCGCIHPAKKQVVGQRLALLALTRTYGISGIDPYTPVYDYWEIEDGRALVYFNVGDMGLAPLGHVLEGFEVAGADKEFHPATAVIKSAKVIEVTCPDVYEPVAIRYAFHNCAEASLYNGSGIPASSFRTDEW